MPTATVAGADIATRLRARLEAIRSSTMAAAQDAMEDALQAGESTAHARIEGAVTPTGQRREQNDGGEAGRVVTGTFDEGFTHSVERTGDNSIHGRQGWGEDDLPKYFGAQEYNATGHNVEDVHALLDATTVAKEEFKKQLTDHVRSEFR